MEQPRSRRAIRRQLALLVAILVLAAALRAWGLGFGLPAMYDPDEPLFVMNALKLLRDQTFNPGWFGHPGSTTIYALAAIDAGVFGAGLASGRFADASGFAQAIYADATLIFLPNRVFILLCGVACVALTWALGRRLFGDRVGLLAAALLAIDPVHVAFSQLIRTDVHASVFMLACLLACANIVERGRVRDHVWAGVWLGLACATKWPAGVVVVAIVGATVARALAHPGERARQLRLLALAAVVTLMALFAASPFLFLDYPTLLDDLRDEARTYHPGATGHGFFGNLGWYLGVALRDALGLGGLALGAVGVAVAARRSRAFAWTVLPVAVVLLLLISAQALIWTRWIVPLLPIAAIAVAVAVAALARAVRQRGGLVAARAVAAVAVMAVAVPSVLHVRDNATERLNDTRGLATAWLQRNVPRGNTVIIEHLALDLLGKDWKLLYAVGDGGCVDFTAQVQGKIDYATIDKWRGDRSIIDLGTIAPKMLPTCAADYAIFVNYDRYLSDPVLYANELAAYRWFIDRGRIVQSFAPVRGRTGGPLTRIVRIDRSRLPAVGG